MNETQAERVVLSVRDCATRAKRSVRTIERWIASGDLAVYEIRNARGELLRRVVHEEDLLTVLRARLLANPNRARNDDD